MNMLFNGQILMRLNTQRTLFGSGFPQELISCRRLDLYACQDCALIVLCREPNKQLYQQKESKHLFKEKSGCM